ncbi:MAG: ATP-binding protein [Thainema sp.]
MLQSLRQSITRIMPSSLQFRLTAGVTAVSVIAIGSIAGWTSWRMQQILVASRKENIVNVAERVEQDTAAYRTMMSLPEALQKSIDSRTTPNLVLWISDQQTDQPIAQSDTLNTTSWQRDGTAQELLDLSGSIVWPDVQRIGDRYLVLCGGPFEVNGTPIGRIYVAEDITRDQRSLLMVVRTLSIASFFGAIIMAVIIAWYIRRSLRPLRKMSLLAGEVSAQDLDQAHLDLRQAPSEVQELAQAFNNMLSRLSMAWTQQRQFVSNISHELRTPLTLVHGYLQSTLRRCQNLTDPQREGLEIAASEADRTVHLLGDLLELARAESGNLRLHRESILLKELALDIINLTPTFRDRIQLDLNNSHLEIYSDRQRLKQVLINLLDNAVKYANAKQPILLRISQEQERVVIQVCDRGKGIPPEHLIHLFEPFYRIEADRCRTTGGTGLGLSIVKTLVTCLGGQVEVQSQLGKGSIFTVTLPA